ncbi:MAG: permease [Clostridiales bacterium]|nr:permease [Clostridiales bacterium]
MEKEKKSLKWLWIAIALVVVAAIGVWCGINAKIFVNDKTGNTELNVFGIPALLTGIFIVTALGYLLGRITIKGVNLGTAGVFLVAILFGYLCTLIPQDLPILSVLRLEARKGNTTYYKSVIQNVGLVLFVGSVGFIAGPKFFRDLAKNFKTYIVLGISIILIGTLVAVIFTLVSPYGADFWAGILSGALTSTPGYSAAQEAMTQMGASDAQVTIGHAIAYPFGVIGVVLFVQLLPRFVKADMNYERSLLKPEVMEATEEKVEKKLFKCDDFGFTALAIAIVSGLILGGIKIPLFGGVSFSLGTTGGVLIMCLVFGHFGRIGSLSMEIPTATVKALKELGLMLFLIGAGVDGGVSLVSAIGGDAGIIVWGFVGGALMTIIPMIAGFFLGKYVLKLPLLNNLGSITGGMTSTPALGTLIATAETDDVAGAYASTYPIALVLIVVACNLMINLMI